LSSTALSEKKVTISVSGRNVENTRVRTLADLKALIYRVAQQNGIGRFEVYMNGNRVSPEELEKVFKTSNNLKLEIIPTDVAASSWRINRICDLQEILPYISPNSFFLRQKDLPLKRYKSIAVAGLGGIGSWIGLFLGISRLVDRLELIDFDYIESHNLNRTPYWLNHICLLKTKALADLIRSVNKNVEIVTYDLPLEQVIRSLKSSILIEATDSLKLRPILEEWISRGNKLITVHYDGESLTIGVNMVPGQWTTGDETEGYSTAPVYVATPVVAAALALHLVMWAHNRDLLDSELLIKTTLSDIVNQFAK